MSKESAEKFVDAWEAGDAEVIKALEAQDDSVLLDPEALADVAGGIGFDVTEEELRQLFARRRRRIIGAVDQAVVSDEDLAQVSGGRNDEIWPPRCSSDYDPNSKCVFNDRCLTAIHYYRASRRCFETFEPDEHCFHDDNCNQQYRCYNPMYN
ncbi:MAG: hypothetical protein IJ092_10605, partial [Atopobiaceae bacterium]|nr:hypothetical protein [Atopobiaceae bacterium]